MSFIRRGFQAYDGNNTPDFVKNGNFVLNKDSPQVQDLVYWWPLSFAGKVSVRDMIGHARGSVRVNSPGITAKGVRGQGLDFNGTDQYATTVLTELPVNQLTESFWMYPRTLPSEGNTFQDIMDRNGDTWNLFFRLATSNLEWKLPLSSGDARVTVPEADLTKNSWQLVTATYNGARKAMSIDGVEKGAQESQTGTILGAGTEFNFARNQNGGSLWDGLLNDVRIWRSGLTPIEVWRLFDPNTRWDLYYELGRRMYVFVPTAATSFPPWKTPITHLLAR